MDQLLHFASQVFRPRQATRFRLLQPLLVQSEYALTTKRSGDLACGSTAQFLGSGHFDLRLRIVVSRAIQPAAEPFVSGQATPLVVSVAIVGFKHRYFFLCANCRIDLRRLRKSLAGAGDGKEITNG